MSVPQMCVQFEYLLSSTPFPPLCDCKHSDHRARVSVDIVTEYKVQLGRFQIQVKFYLEKMKLR